MNKNENFAKVIKKKPLLLFSVYSQIQADNLIEIGQDISNRISKILRKKGTVDKGFNKAYGYLSLWIFGAYEMVRTLDQGKARFTKDTQTEINQFKKKISELRVPLAKQELAGNKGGVTYEASVMDVDFDKKDFTFTVKGQDYHFKELFKEYKNLINSINEDSFEK